MNLLLSLSLSLHSLTLRVLCVSSSKEPSPTQASKHKQFSFTATFSGSQSLDYSSWVSFHWVSLSLALLARLSGLLSLGSSLLVALFLIVFSLGSFRWLRFLFVATARLSISELCCWALVGLPSVGLSFQAPHQACGRHMPTIRSTARNTVPSLALRDLISEISGRDQERCPPKRHEPIAVPPEAQRDEPRNKSSDSKV